MSEFACYVLVYEHPDHNTADGSKSRKKAENLRRQFTAEMKKEKLEVLEDRVGKHVFVKITCPMGRLYKEAENMRVDLPLYGMNIENPAAKQATIEKVQNMLQGGQTINIEVSAPFQEKCMCWFIDNNPEHMPIMWSALRCLLVYNILINIDLSKTNEEGHRSSKQGLSYLLMAGAYNDGFVLHDPSVKEPVSVTQQQSQFTNELLNSRRESDPEAVDPWDPRRELSKSWNRLFRRQPLQMIRNYFGEKIAFYFAWVGTFISSLWIPAILGSIVFVYGVVSRLNTITGKEGFLHYVEIVKNSSDNVLTPGFAAIICLWGTILMEVWKRKQISLAHQWHVENFDMDEPDRPQFYGTVEEVDPLTKQIRSRYPFQRRLLKYFTSTTALLFMVLLVFISVTSVILYRVYMTVSFCEEGDGVCDLLHGTFIATFLNTVSIMILGRIYEFIAVKLTDWENHRRQSMYNDALIIKLFAFQFANTYASLFYTAFFRMDLGGIGILGLDPKYTDNCGAKENSNCMSMLSFQLLVLMVVKPFPKFFRDVVLPRIKILLRRCGLNEIRDVTTDAGVSKQHYLLREKLKPAAEDFRLGEFTEKVIQYGYLMLLGLLITSVSQKLFAASFPLAPLLALLFNVIDIRVDAKRLLWWNRRPTPYRDNDIGIWFHIINFINVVGVISNSFLIAFTSELGREKPLAHKLGIIIGFEHFIFLMKFLISLIIPDVPTWVQNSQRKERFLISYLMAKNKPNENGGLLDENFVFTKVEQPVSEPTRRNPVMLRQVMPQSFVEGEQCDIPKSRWSYG